jgi:hypothetical protein
MTALHLSQLKMAPPGSKRGQVARIQAGLGGLRRPRPSLNASLFHPHAATGHLVTHRQRASPLSLTRPDHRRAVRVFHLEPIPRRARPVGCGQPLRDDALQAHYAGMPEDGGAVLVRVVAQHDAEPAPAQQPRQPLLAVVQGQAAEVLAVELKEVESVQHGLGNGATAVQSIEDGDRVCRRPATDTRANLATSWSYHWPT